MEFFDVVKRRRSIRAFLPRSVPEDKLRAILEAAITGPSAGNFQSFEIFVIRDKRRRETLARASKEQLFIASAPVILVFAKHPALSAERYGKRADALYSIQDASIACTLALLAAASEGLACCWIGAFEPEEIRKIIGASRGVVPVAMLPIGYAAEKAKCLERRPLDDLVHWEA